MQLCQVDKIIECALRKQRLDSLLELYRTFPIARKPSASQKTEAILFPVDETVIGAIHLLEEENAGSFTLIALWPYVLSLFLTLPWVILQ